MRQGISAMKNTDLIDLYPRSPVANSRDEETVDKGVKKIVDEISFRLLFFVLFFLVPTISICPWVSKDDTLVPGFRIHKLSGYYTVLIHRCPFTTFYISVHVKYTDSYHLFLLFRVVNIHPFVFSCGEYSPPQVEPPCCKLFISFVFAWVNSRQPRRIAKNAKIQ